MNQHRVNQSVVYKPRTMEMARSFITSVVNECRGCLRRSEYNCANCFAVKAKTILREMQSDENDSPVDYSLYARMKRIRDIISAAGRPVMSRFIRLDGMCSFQLKLYTLKHMVKIGILGCSVAKRRNGRKYYYYFLKSGSSNKETKHENNTTGNRQL